MTRKIRYKKTGLQSYLLENKVTPGFISELETIASIIYVRSDPPLKVSREEFISRSRLQVLEALPLFSPEKGLINDYVYTVILNLSRTIKVETFPETAGEILDETGTPFSFCFTSSSHLSRHRDFDLRTAILSFAQYAHSQGIFINQASLYSSILTNKLTLLSKAFLIFYKKGDFTDNEHQESHRQ